MLGALTAGLIVGCGDTSPPDELVVKATAEAIPVSLNLPDPVLMKQLPTTTTLAPTTTVPTPPSTTTTVVVAATTPSSVAPPTTSSPSTNAASAGHDWDAVAQCESGGDWHINTGNGYYGGLQFSLSSWQATGGTGYPHQHSRETQIHHAEILLDMQGAGAWPHCGKYL